jgi:hypothetical protein
MLAGTAILTVIPSVANAALIADWEMNEGPGASVMTDSAGHDNDGAIYSVETGVAGLAGGKAYKFDGATSYIQVPDRDNLDPGNAAITITATVKVENAQIIDDSYEVIRKGVVTTKGGEWKMEIKRSGTDATVGRLHCVFKGVLASGATSLADVVASVDVVDSQAHQLQCKKTSGKVIALVDGRSFSKSVAAGSISNDQPVIIGAKVLGDDEMQGVMDRVKVNIG